MNVRDKEEGRPPRRDAAKIPSWRSDIWVPLLAALVGSAIGLAGGVYVADRQIAESRRMTNRQIAESRHQAERQVLADRAGRLSDVRAETYGEFVSAVERHVDIIGGPSEESVRQADQDITAALRLVQLRGSAAAYDQAEVIAGRARKLTNASISAIQRGISDQVPDQSFFAQQEALDRFARSAHARTVHSWLDPASLWRLARSFDEGRAGGALVSSGQRGPGLRDLKVPVRSAEVAVGMRLGERGRQAVPLQRNGARVRRPTWVCAGNAVRRGGSAPGALGAP